MRKAAPPNRMTVMPRKTGRDAPSSSFIRPAP
jgi:hypothetical protein